MMVVADILYHDSNILRRSDPVRVKSMCGNLEFPCAHPCLFRIGELFAGRGCVHKIFSEGGKSGSVRAPRCGNTVHQNTFPQLTSSLEQRKVSCSTMANNSPEALETSSALTYLTDLAMA